MNFMQKNGSALFKLALSAWFLANSICLIGNRAPFLTLAFVKEISFIPYCILWGLLFFGSCFLWFGPKKVVLCHIALFLSISLYITTILMKEVVFI